MKLQTVLPVINSETIEIKIYDTEFKFEVTSKELTFQKILAKEILDAEVKNIAAPDDCDMFDALSITVDISK